MLGGTTALALSSGTAIFSGLTLNLIGDGYQLQASTMGLPSTSTSFDVVPGPAAQLVVTNGPPATVTAGSEFELDVIAEDAEGNVASDFAGSMNVAIFSGPADGTLSGTLNVAATSSVAVFSDLSINQAGTNYTLQVSGFGLSSATTTAIQVIPGAVAQLAIGGGPPASVAAGGLFGFTVTAEDAEGNLVSSGNQQVTIALSNNPGGSTLGGTTTLALSSGIGVFSGLSLNRVGSGYKFQASTVGLLSTTTTFNVVPGPVAQFVVTGEPPPTITAGTGFTMTAVAEDAEGNVASGVTGSVSVAIASGPVGGTLSGTLNLAASGGVAVFSNLVLNKSGSNYTLQVTGLGLPSVTTTAIQVIPGAIAQLVIGGGPPSSVAAGGLFGFTVMAEDAGGNLLSGANQNVTIALANNPGGSTLGGATTLALSSGISIFSGLSLNRVGTGYQIQASTAGLLSTTSTFNVLPGPVAQFVMTGEPPTTVMAGAGFAITVAAEDAEGNVASGVTGSVSVAITSGPAGGTLSGTLSLAASGGLAVFSNLVLNKSGSNYTLQVTGLGLPSVTTTAIRSDSRSNRTTGHRGRTALECHSRRFVRLHRYRRRCRREPGQRRNQNVTVALSNNPGGSTLGGTTTLALASGLAVFSDLTLNKVGTGYTLAIRTVGVATSTTTGFRVIPGAATHLLVTNQPPATITAGNSFGLTVELDDANGNLATAFNGEVTVGAGDESRRRQPGGDALGRRRQWRCGFFQPVAGGSGQRLYAEHQRHGVVIDGYQQFGCHSERPDNFDH